MYNRMQTFIMLLIRDARVFKRHIFGRFIDACIWSGIVLYVSQYIMPHFGTNPSFGKFMLVGNIAAWGMLEAATNVATLVSDVMRKHSIMYYLSLPIPQSWIFIRIALMDGYKSFISTLPMLPVGKLILGEHLSLCEIAYGKLFLMYLLSHIFFGFLGLFLASITPDLSYLTTIKLRIVFPLWFVGGYQFSWAMLYKTNPTLAYINLANPVVYIMEGMRSTVGTDTYLIPYTTCIIMTIMFTAIFGYIGIILFKKRLDCL
tara:strand:- start:1053 stop:1832 length:780 start_codon:yes stop_codon:yes gene_type:complete